MISDDENDPKTKKPKPRALDKFSIPELKEYLQQLKDEQSRVEADIRKKESSLSAAAALFKS